MLATLSKPNTFGHPLMQEDGHHWEIKLQATGVIDGMTELIDEGIAQFVDTFEIHDDDFIRWDSARTLVLHHIVAYLLQRPVAPDEIIAEHHLDGRKAGNYFRHETYTPFAASKPTPKVDNSAELELLRRENARLKLENEALRCEKQLAEEQAIYAMRRRPSSRFGRSYATLDEMVGDMLTNAVADGIRQTLGTNSSENFLRGVAALQGEDASHV